MSGAIDMAGVKMILIVTLLSLGIAGWSPLSLAGNEQMVEEAVADLDELNKQAVEQIPDLPADGQIDIKANVTYKKDSPVFDIYYKNVAGEKEETLHFGEDQGEKNKEKGKVEENDDKDN